MQYEQEIDIMREELAKNNRQQKQTHRTLGNGISRHRPTVFIIGKEIKAKHYYFDRKLKTIKTAMIET